MAALEKITKNKETFAAKRDEASKKVEDLRQRIGETQARLDSLKGEQGSIAESETETRRLKELERKITKWIWKREKELAERKKQAQNKEKAQKKVDRLRASLAAKESERNAMEERLNNTKTLDELKEQGTELQRQNKEDQAIIQDEEASPSDKQPAQGRVAEKNEELARLQTQIAERERTRPLLKRIKEIIKKYGVTLTAIFLAAGVTIGAVIGAITKALKATGQALGNGLKEIGKKKTRFSAARAPRINCEFSIQSRRPSH